MVDLDGAVSDDLEVLADDERIRAGRFRLERDRLRFTRRRAFLRRVLAEYTGASPGVIRFRRSVLGRPSLEPACGLYFNASHSAGLAVVAVAHRPHVGVDIERQRPIASAVELARDHFSASESSYVESTPQGSRSDAFLTMWTRKESYAKAVGAGLSLPFDGFDVSATGGSQTGRPRDEHGDLPFVFADMTWFDGYVGAVTLSGARVRARLMSGPMPS